MKKTFWPFSLMTIVLRIFMFGMAGAGLYIVLTSPLTDGSVLLSIIALVVFVIGLAYSFYKVKFLENGIKVFALFPFIIHQHQLFIEYSKIQELRMIMVSKDSKKRKIPSSARGMPPIYLCFVLGKRTHEWVYVSAFSNKQIDKMLEIIKEKTGLNYEYDRKHKKLIDLNPKETEEQTNN